MQKNEKTLTQNPPLTRETCPGYREGCTETCKTHAGECLVFRDALFTDYQNDPTSFDLYPEDQQLYREWLKRQLGAQLFGGRG